MCGLGRWERAVQRRPANAAKPKDIACGCAKLVSPFCAKSEWNTDWIALVLCAALLVCAPIHRE